MVSLYSVICVFHQQAVCLLLVLGVHIAALVFAVDSFAQVCVNPGLIL